MDTTCLGERSMATSTPVGSSRDRLVATQLGVGKGTSRCEEAYPDELTDHDPMSYYFVPINIGGSKMAREKVYPNGTVWQGDRCHPAC